MENVIYKISNNVNSKIYIGSSNNFKRRKTQHLHHLRKETHHSRILQNHVRKYGINTLFFEIIDYCRDGSLIEKEQFYIDTLNPYFNIRKIAESNKGLKRTKEQIEKMKKNRIYKKGYKNSKEHNLKIKESKAKNNYKHSEETKEKISKGNKGKKRSKEFVENLSKRMIGFKHKESSKKKSSISKIGDKNPMFGKSGVDHHNFGKKIIQKNPKKGRKIIDLNTNIIYENYKEACEELKIPKGTMARYLSNKVKSIKNYKYYE